MGNIFSSARVTELEKEVTDLKKQVGSHKAELERLVEAHKAELERLMEAHKAELERLVEAHKADQARLVEAHKADQARLAQVHATEIEGLKSEKKAVDELATANALKADEQRTQLEQKIRELEATILQRRLSDVRHVDDGSFVRMKGNLGFDSQTFPFTNLVAGHLADGTLVLRVQLRDEYLRVPADIQRFKQSIAIMQTLSGADDHLLRLVGGCDLETDNPIAFVEYFPGTDLQTFVRQNEELSWHKKLDIAHQIATALVAVHNKAMLHRDLNWSRVFIASDGRIKVFVGLNARDRPAGHPANGVTDDRWGAPETLHGTYSDKSDIFSLGLILISLITRDLPFTYLTTQRNHPIDDDLLKERLKSTVDGYLTLTAPFGEAPPAFMILALSCISYAPSKRPTASEAVRRLEEQLQEMAEKEANVTPVSTARPVVAIDLTVTKASGLSSTSSTLYCTVALDDANRTALDTTPVKSEGGVYSWPTPLTFSDVKPLESMLDLTLMAKGMFSDSKVGKASMRLEDLLSVDDDDATETPSLDAPRTATLDLFSSGERKGSLEVSVTFSADLRAYLTVYVEEKSKLISFYAGKNANHNSDYQRKRDMAAVLLATAHP